MRESPSKRKIIRFLEYEADLPAGQLRRKGRRVRLREQSFKVLTMLLEHAGEVVSREELRGRLWPEDVFVDFDNNLNCSVAKLREVLHDSAEHPRFIETLPKHGSRFIASISRPAVTPDLTQAHKAGVECLDIPSIVALPTKVFGASEAAFLTDAVPSTLSTMLAGVAGIDTKVPPSSVEFELIKGDLTKIAEAYHVENPQAETLRRKNTPLPDHLPQRDFLGSTAL